MDSKDSAVNRRASEAAFAFGALIRSRREIAPLGLIHINGRFNWPALGLQHVATPILTEPFGQLTLTYLKWRIRSIMTERFGHYCVM